LILKIYIKLNLHKFIISLFLLVYFIPEVFDSVDRIGPQWTVLSLLNLVVSSYFLYRYNDYIKPFIKNIKIESKYLICYSLFILFSFISIIYAQNLAEFIITFSQYFTIFTTFILLSICFGKLKDKVNFFLNLNILLVCLEVSYILILFSLFFDYEIGIVRNRFYGGAAANVNIAAFSLVFKVPFVLYKLYKTKGNLKILFCYLLLFSLILFCVFISFSRGAFLALSFSVVTSLVYFIYFEYKRNRFFIKNLVLMLFFILVTFMTYNFLNKNKQVLSHVSYSTRSLVDRYSTISINTQDGSVNQRLRYYNQIIARASKNPFLGVGLGNHKLISIKDDNFGIKKYIIPYHAHNDFLQILSESGLLALIPYLLLFYFMIKYLFDLWNNNYLDKRFLIFSCLIALGVYIIDSMLNFPIARPISQLQWVFLISMIVSLYINFKKDEKV